MNPWEGLVSAITVKDEHGNVIWEKRLPTTVRKLQILAPRIAALFPPTAMPPCACVAPSCLELGCPTFWYIWLAEAIDDRGKRFKQLETLYEAVEEIIRV